jgi:hypothetical protein
MMMMMVPPVMTMAFVPAAIYDYDFSAMMMPVSMAVTMSLPYHHCLRVSRSTCERYRQSEGGDGCDGEY